MSTIDKSLPSLSEFEDQPIGRLPRFGKIDFHQDLYSTLENLKYPELIEYLQFFSNMENFESLMTDENTNAFYYYCKTLRKIMVSTLDNFDKGEKKSLREFLTEAFFATWDLRIKIIPTMVNKRVAELNEYIDWEELRKDYPLAAKSNYHLLTNKKFLEEVKNKFLGDYSSKNPDFYKHIMDQIKNIKDPKEHVGNIIDTLNDIETGTNIIEIYINDYLIKGICTRFYTDHEKKKRTQEGTKDQKYFSVVEDGKHVLDKVLDGDGVEIVSKINLLDDGQIKLIDKIVANFSHLGEKNKKQIRKYLIRLLVNKKPLKVDKFLENYNLESLPDIVVVLLDDLGIDVIFKQKDDDIQDLNQQSIDRENKDNKEEFALEIEEINKKLLSLFMKDPLSAIITKAKMCGYEIENENSLRKQIESACKSSKYVKNSLLLSLFKESFSRPILKYSGVYSLRAGGSGYRFILRQSEEGKFMIVGFYNHDDYEQVLDGRKG